MYSTKTSHVHHCMLPQYYTTSHHHLYKVNKETFMKLGRENKTKCHLVPCDSYTILYYTTATQSYPNKTVGVSIAKCSIVRALDGLAWGAESVSRIFFKLKKDSTNNNSVCFQNRLRLSVRRCHGKSWVHRLFLWSQVQCWKITFFIALVANFMLFSLHKF